MCSPGSAIAQCINYGDYLRWVGGVTTPGYVNDVAVSGNYAYVANGLSGLQVIDIADPQDPKIVGSVDTPGEAWGVAVSGSYAYVADKRSGLQVVDISTPESPVIVGSAKMVEAWSVAIEGNYAYVADFYLGLQVVDISTAVKPVIVGKSDRPGGGASSVAVSGGYAYVPHQYFGLLVMDIRSPERPVTVGAIDIPGWCRDIALSGNLAYIADFDAGLHVADVSIPAAPLLVGHLEMPAGATGVAISGKYVYLAHRTLGLQEIDASSAENPRIQGRLGMLSGATGVTVSEDYAYITVGGEIDRYRRAVSGLQVAILTTLEAPLTVEVVTTQGPAEDVAILGDYAYIAGDFGFQVIDIANVQGPQIVATLDMHALDIAVSGTFAYIAASYSGLYVVDISMPGRPVIVGHLSPRPPNYEDSYTDIAIIEDYAFVGGKFGLSVIDISNPADPELVSTLDTGRTVCVAISGGLAYVAAGSSFLVVDISIAANPEIIGSLETRPSSADIGMSGRAIDAAISGNLAYVAIRTILGGQYVGELQVVDISNPALPEIVGSVDTPYIAWGVAVSANYAYVADVRAGLQVIDITNAAKPEIVGGGFSAAFGVAVSGSHVYAGGSDFPWHSYLQILPLQCDSAAHRPPIASAGGPYTGECHMPLTFDATGSVAQDGSIVSYEWDWDGDGVFDEMTPSPTTSYTYEATFVGSIRLRVTDDQDPPMTSECEAQVSVADTKTPQIVDVALLPDVQWLKTQQMVAFQLGVEAQDLCDPNPTSRIVSVTTDPLSHPNGNHAARLDSEITNALSLKLPLDFSQGRTGRLYRVTVVSSDEIGNASAATAEVRVAFDHGRPLVLMESLELDQELPADLIAHSGDSARSGSGEMEEVAKSNPSTEGQHGTYALGLVGTFPNPMGRQGQVQFFLPAAAHVRLAIYDVRGRLVRTLAQGSYSPGLHSASWESRSDDGSVLSQGIYFARLDVDGQRFTRRFVVVR